VGKEQCMLLVYPILAIIPETLISFSKVDELNEQNGEKHNRK
jgi:hypothetical protein